MILPVENGEAPTKLLAAGFLFLAAVLGGGVVVVARFVDKRTKAGDGDSGGGKVLLGRGGKVTRNATNGDKVVNEPGEATALSTSVHSDPFAAAAASPLGLIGSVECDAWIPKDTGRVSMDFNWSLVSAPKVQFSIIRSKLNYQKLS